MKKDTFYLIVILLLGGMVCQSCNMIFDRNEELKRMEMRLAHAIADKNTFYNRSKIFEALAIERRAALEAIQQSKIQGQ